MKMEFHEKKKRKEKNIKIHLMDGALFVTD